VVAWNLTRRCNLECAHCYIAAGPREDATAELDTATCLDIVDQLLGVNPAPMLILSGGEPLMREDLTQIARYAAAKGATVVVGTNGTLLTDERIGALKQAGVRGVAVSVDSLRPSYHDNFRHGKGSLAETRAALARLAARRLDFIIQTTVTKGNRAELGALVEWAAAQGAVSFNCYFLVSTGRGASLTDLAPPEYEAVLADLARWQGQYRGRMLVRAKCAPHFMRHVHAADPDSPIRNYETRCPWARSTVASRPTGSSPRAPTCRRWQATCVRRASRRSGGGRRCSGNYGRASWGGSAALANTAGCAGGAGPERLRSKATCSRPTRRAYTSRHLARRSSRGCAR